LGYRVAVDLLTCPVEAYVGPEDETYGIVQSVTYFKNIKIIASPSVTFNCLPQWVKPERKGEHLYEVHKF